ncbi:MAG TPA: DUF6350 family protein [Actinomycetes bacterium]|nr:DUF6350 family protein [Actinomycetes bacterium]
MAAPTDVLRRPPGPRAPRRPPAGPGRSAARPLTALGMTAALQSAGLGVLAVMVTVLVGWATAADSDASATAAVTGALQAWLVGHHAEVTVPGGSFGLAPLGLTLLPLLLLHTSTLRAGRAAGVRSRRAVLALTASVTATYAVLVTVVALLARTDTVRPQPVSAFVGAALVAGLASGTAAVRATGRAAVLWHRLPEPARRPVLPAAAASLVLVAGGALLAGGSLAVHHEQARALTAGLDGGAGGTMLLLLGCLLYVPTAAVWGLAFCVGPGFAVGAGTSVGVAGSTLGAVPALPLLAALPAGTGSASWWLALAVPVGAGVAAGVVADRTPGRPPGDAAASIPSIPYVRTLLRSTAETAGLVGGLVAGAVAGLAWLSAGPAGPDRLATTGSDWWVVGPAAGLEVAAAAAVTLAALAGLRHRRRPDTDA